MAIKLATSKENIKVISRQDSAVPSTLTDEEWADYQATLDESKLRLEGEPTRFILRRHLPFAAQQSIANQQMGISAEGKPELRLGYIMEEVRCALVGIENPAGVEDPLVFAKDPDGFASRDLIALLNSVGIAMELFTLRQSKGLPPVKK